MNEEPIGFGAPIKSLSSTSALFPVQVVAVPVRRHPTDPSAAVPTLFPPLDPSSGQHHPVFAGHALLRVTGEPLLEGRPPAEKSTCVHAYGGDGRVVLGSVGGSRPS